MTVKFKFNRIVEQIWARVDGEEVEGHLIYFLPDQPLCSGFDLWQKGKPDGSFNKDSTFVMNLEVSGNAPTSAPDPIVEESGNPYTDNP